MSTARRTTSSLLTLLTLGALGPLAHAQAAPTARTVERSGRDEALRLDWSLSFVQLSGLSNRVVQTRVNRALLREAVGTRTAMRRDLREWESTSEYDSTLSVGMTVGLLTDDLLSVSITVSTMYSGAAHPNTGVDTLTYDLRTGLKVPARALLRPGDDTLAAVAAKVDAALRANPEYTNDGEYYLNTVTPEDLTGILVERDGLRFIFGDQQIGPHAAGLPEVLLTWEQLDGLAARDGALARARAGLATPGLVGGVAR